MKRDSKLAVKLVLIFFGLLFLVCIRVEHDKVEDETETGEMISKEDVEILMEALGIPDGADDYNDDITLKKDWYDEYKTLLAKWDRENTIWETTVFVLKTDPEKKLIYTENGTMQGAYEYRSSAFADSTFKTLRVYVQGDTFLTVIEEVQEEHRLDNVWVVEAKEAALECFYRQVYFTVPLSANAAGKLPASESVADLTFANGSLLKQQGKNEKIHGKLLRVGDDEIEIEGCGVYQLAENVEIYKLYGALETLKKSDLKIGYEDTDYVISKDTVCACLVSEDDTADRIRVLLKNTADNSDYFSQLELVVDGETFAIQEKDLEIGEHRIFQPANLTDRITVNLPGSTREDNDYRGSIECYRIDSGLVVINELPLEEYLYAVVPSEMPASYPMEALKAQAVCARTYGYQYILHAGIPQLGAHVDDTTSYQVYHNIAENAETTRAVKETDGIVLTSEGEPAEISYYSTSCGSVGSEALQDEETFRQFITSTGEDDLEKNEPWYRWKYEVTETDNSAMLKRLQERYQAVPSQVLTRTDGGYYVSEPVEELEGLRNIKVAKRSADGAAEELLIETDENTYKIVGEYNIRYVLCDRESSVIRQDDTAITPGMLVPSGFFVIETGKTDKNVIGYRLVGGGYGHGVGMSQNGAKALGEQGMAYEEILQAYFPEYELIGNGQLDG
jgi:stage II sporulation protein D